MGDVADHGLALGLHAFAAFGEVVEGLGQDAGLVPGLHRHPDVQFRRLLGRFGQRAQGADEPGRDHGRDEDGEGEDPGGRADDLGLVRRGDGEAGCGGVPAAQEEFGHRRHVGVELGAAGAVGAGLRLADVGGVAQLVVGARDVAGAEVLVEDVDAEVRGLEAHAFPRQAGLGAHDQAFQRLALGGGRGVELPVGALVGHVAVGVVAVRVGEDGTAARRHRDGRVDAVLFEARLTVLGQLRQPDPLLRGHPVRADDPGVETAELCAGFRVRVGVQGVDARGGARRERGAVRCGVGDEGAVGGREGDAAAHLLRQCADGGRDALPLGVGRGVSAELREDAHVVREVLALFLPDGPGGGRHREPGRRPDRADGDQHGGDEQPDQQPLAQRYPGPHARPPRSL